MSVRPHRLRVLGLLLPLGLLAACGGEDERGRSALPPVPQLTVPGESKSDARAVKRRLAREPADENAPADATEDKPGDQAAAPDEDGGNAAQDQPSQSTQTAPATGGAEPPSNAGRFEGFCAENPGAC